MVADFPSAPAKELALLIQALTNGDVKRGDTSDTGPRIDKRRHRQFPKGANVIQTFAAQEHIDGSFTQQRIGQRRRVRVPGRLTWRDAAGTLRFASVVTRDVSDVDAFVECQVPASIPLFRLVHLQIERPARDCGDLPPVLQQGGKVLTAVYRVGPYKSSTGTPQGYALRLLVDPCRSQSRTAFAAAASSN